MVHHTNILSRKRAKTEDEKEQRRVERVLRNRRAAQSSRERKRQEVEALEAEKREVERRNQDLEMRLAESQAELTLLRRELGQITGNKMRVFQGSSTASSPAAEQLRAATPVTFSQELFSSRDEIRSSISTQSIAEPTIRTVNPASLSPEMRPVAEFTNASSSDMTQHPAAMLCDLQCQSEEQRPWMNSTPTQISAALLLINMITVATSTILSPLTQIVNTLKTQSYLSPTPSILTLIIWLVTTTASLTSSTLMTSYTNTKTSPRPRFSLRIPLLRRLLASNPHLARPLMDATMSAMRLASEQQLIPVCLSGEDASPSQGGKNSPSVESLMTLYWATNVISKERLQAPRDVATEVRQTCDELHSMFRPREMRGRKVSLGGMVEGQKSLEGWRPTRP